MKKIDYTGEKIGWLTVQSEIQERKRGAKQYICLCECGNTCIVSSSKFTGSSFVSCGCYRFRKYEKVILEKIGKEIGRLTPLTYYIEKNKQGHNKWMLKCQCRCGNTYIGDARRILNKKIVSCGCYRKEIAYNNCKKHGLSNHRLNRIWRAMKNRCNNPKTPRYKDYGGRGIKVCDEWEDNFENFYYWAINNGYNENLSIDRINNDGNYEPSNCRWANDTEQVINQRQTKTNSTGEKNISYDSKRYACRVRRYGKQRVSYFKELEEAIKIRDKWLEEYKKDKDKWIEDTINNEYIKSIDSN